MNNAHPIAKLFYVLSACSLIGTVFLLTQGEYNKIFISMIIAGGVIQASIFIGFGLVIQYLYEIAYAHRLGLKSIQSNKNESLVDTIKKSETIELNKKGDDSDGGFRYFAYFMYLLMGLLVIMKVFGVI